VKNGTRGHLAATPPPPPASEIMLDQHSCVRFSQKAIFPLFFLSRNTYELFFATTCLSYVDYTLAIGCLDKQQIANIDNCLDDRNAVFCYCPHAKKEATLQLKKQ